METVKKYSHVLIISVWAISFIMWTHSQFNELKKDVFLLEKEVCMMKTFIIMKNIMPNELTSTHTEQTPKNN